MYVATSTFWIKIFNLNCYAFTIDGKVTMSAGDVIKQFTVELVHQLPLEDDIFFAMAKHADLFPLDISDSIVAKPTRAKKVSYFLQHVVKPGAEEYLPKLLKLMKDSQVTNLVRLADDIQAAADQGMYIHYS